MGFVLALLLSAAGFAAEAQPRAKHVVVIVFDGLRPDSVTEADMPTLYRLAHEGTSFAHHHPVYLSTTEVNGTALATGAFPRNSGVMANDEYRPELELLKPFGTQDLEIIRKSDKLTSGQYLHMPTVAEIARAAGLRTAVAGTKPVVLLLDRAARENSDSSAADIVVFRGQTLPQSVGPEIRSAAGTIPKEADPTREANRLQDRWTTHVLVDRLWQSEVPPFSTLWMSEPDFAQHGSGPGSAPARLALRSDDDNLASVLAALDRAGVRDSTDILVVSDHGFSTIGRAVDMVGTLHAAGFDAAKSFKENPTDGQILVIPLGGSTSFYVIGHQDSTIHRLVEFLQHSDFAGTIFTRTPVGGAFTLNQSGIDTPDAPDVVLSMRWSELSSETGLPGLIACSAKYHAGQGHHGSLSRFDMHNTLIAIGPDFRSGFVDTLPTGNVDIAPTVLWLLGLGPPKPMDGRVLAEAIRDCDIAVPQPRTQNLTTELHFPDAIWRQYLHTTSIGNTIYCDEGNGQVETMREAGK